MLNCHGVCEILKTGDMPRYDDDYVVSFCSICRAKYDNYVINCVCCGSKTRHGSKYRMHYHRKYYGTEIEVSRL